MNFQILYLKSLLIWILCLHTVQAKYSQRFTIQVQDGFSTAQNIAEKHRKIIHFRHTTGQLPVHYKLTYLIKTPTELRIISKDGSGKDAISRSIYFICPEMAIATFYNNQTENCNFKTTSVRVQNSRS